MGVLECASANSCLNGYDYFKQNKVEKINKINNSTYTAKVKGNLIYDVFLDIKHAKKSTCNCPHANGKRIICKHIVATYFTIYPEEAQRFIDECFQDERESDEFWNRMERKLKIYLSKCTKAELIAHINELLEECPEWLYEKFIADYIDDKN